MSNELRPSPPEGHQSPFELIRRTNEAGREFWSSRDFAQILDYGNYRNFEQVIQRARMACFNSGQRIEDHFVEVNDMIRDRATQTEEKLRRENIKEKNQGESTVTRERFTEPITA